MKKNKRTTKTFILAGTLAGAVVMTTTLSDTALAAQQSMSSVTEQAQIQPIGDGSNKYIMKSDGFYCLDVNGAKSNQTEIHYFQDYEIDGTVFDGYYYHDTDGKFKACSPHMERLKGVTVFKNTEAEETTDAQKTQETDKFEGLAQVAFSLDRAKKIEETILKIEKVKELPDLS